MNNNIADKYNIVCQQSLKKIKNNILIKNFEDLDDKQLSIFFKEFYIIVEEFPKQLGLLIFNAPNNKVLFTLADNLVDELGGADNIENFDYSAMHIKLLNPLLKAFGITEDEILSHKPLIATKEYISFLNNGYLNKPFVESIAYIAACMEAIFPEIARIMYTALSKKFTDEQLIHFKEHMIADVKHDNRLRECIYPLISDDVNYNLFVKGAGEAASMQSKMLDGIMERELV